MTARTTARYAGCLAAAAVLLLGGTACSQDPNSVAAQARAGDQKGTSPATAPSRRSPRPTGPSRSS